jgi:hypothetical protein
LSFAPLLSQSFDPDPNGALGSGFEVLRFVRIIRLQRFLADEAAFVDLADAVGISSSKAFQALGQRQLELYLRVARVVGSILSLLLVATGLVYETEHLVNPQIPTFFDALYFGLTTLTTVGFGDITPITAEGRLVVSFSILAGIAFIPVQLSTLADSLLNGGRTDAAATDGDAPPAVECAACGTADHLAGAAFCNKCGQPLPQT